MTGFLRRNVHVIWSAGLWMGCQNASTDLSAAVMLEQQGQVVEAFDGYTDLIQQYPNSLEAKTALRHIQRLQLKTARSFEKTDTTRALALYQSMIERWPGTEYAQIAEQKLAKLSGTVSSKQDALLKVPVERTTDAKGTDVKVENTNVDPIVAALDSVELPIEPSIEVEQMPEPSPEPVLEVPAEVLPKPNAIIDEAELAACETARESRSRVVWQQYKQTFPTGACFAEAEDFLRAVAPRQLEIDEGKVKAVEAQKRLINLCKEYRLTQTTSNEKACENPSRALMVEFARLQKRKSDLLADNDAEKIAYYNKFIPPRWEKLSAAEDIACGELLIFVAEMERKGVDAKALRSEFAMAETCFVEQGRIE